MPTWGEIAELITAMAAIGGLVVSLLNRRKIEQVHIATNSLTDRLVATTRSDANRQGVAEGRALEKAER